MKILTSLRKAKDYLYYSFASIKNRYPFKVIKYTYTNDFSHETIITFSALKQTNIRSRPVKELLDDYLLTEKFHPADCVKLGFIAAGDLLLKDTSSLEEAKIKFNKIIAGMFNSKQG